MLSSEVWTSQYSGGPVVDSVPKQTLVHRIFRFPQSNHIRNMIPNNLMSRNKTKARHHTIEIFSANCPICKEVTDIIELGRCQGCKQIVYDTNNLTEEIKVKMKKYDVRVVPTTIIEGEIKVVGIPKFPWICGDKLYKKLKAEYSL